MRQIATTLLLVLVVTILSIAQGCNSKVDSSKDNNRKQIMDNIPPPRNATPVYSPPDPTLVARNEAASTANHYWTQYYTVCGNDVVYSAFYFFTDRKYINEYHGLQWWQTEDNLSEADRLNGFEWKGTTHLSARLQRSARSGATWDEWGQMSSEMARTELYKKKGKWYINPAYLGTSSNESIRSIACADAVKFTDPQYLADQVRKAQEVELKKRQLMEAIDAQNIQGVKDTVRSLDSLEFYYGPSGSGTAPLCAAIAAGNGVIFDVIANKADANYGSCGFMSPLLYAAKRGWPDAVRILLRRGARVNETGDGGHYTAIDEALANRTTSTDAIIQILRQAGGRTYDELVAIRQQQ